MSKVTIIAEAGVNHNGSLDIARKLIDAAADAGADIVKFQTFTAETLAAHSAKKAAYQAENTGCGTQFEMLKKLELHIDDHLKLMKYAQKRNIRFLSTPFDIKSAEFLFKLGLPIFKIPSGEITNLPYLRKIAYFGKKVIMSTGMANLKEIEDALMVLIGGGLSKEMITVLHCNTAYPTPYSDVNLKAMLTIGQELNVAVGYSDHTLGIEVPIAATALGATIIEKHFTISRSLEGPDHKASLEPDELRAMVTGIRHVAAALGKPEKEPTLSEKANLSIARKSIVAARDIKKGEIFSEENITAKRPGDGISPMKWDEITGKAAHRDFAADELITLEDTNE